MRFFVLRSSLVAVATLAGMVGLASWMNAIRADDCNGNDLPDTEDVSSARSLDCNDNGVPDECELALIRLGVRAGPINVTGQLGAVTTADMDGDGAPEIVVATESRLGILFHPGNEALEDERYTDLFGPARTLGAADVDRDGLGDLVVAGGGSRLAVYWGDAERGLQHQTVQLAATAQLAVPAPLNSHPALDIVLVETETQSITILLGGDDRSFKPGETYRVGRQPSGVAVADLDGNQAVDLAVTNRESGTISLLVGDGQGGFTVHPETPSGGTQPRNPVNGDLNADGFSDVVHLVDTGVAIHLTTARRHEAK